MVFRNLKKISCQAFKFKYLIRKYICNLVKNFILKTLQIIADQSSLRPTAQLAVESLKNP